MREFWELVRISVTAAYMLGLVFVMSRFKRGGKTARLVYCGVVGVAFVFDAALLLLFGRPVMMQFFAVGNAVPCLVALIIFTKDRFPQLFFNFWTSVNAVYLVSVIGLWVSQGEIIWLDTLIRAALFTGILYLFHRYFAGPYHFLAEHMAKGWWVISALPFLFFCMVMYLGLYPTVRHDNFPAVVMLYVVLCLIYVVIYQVFEATFLCIHQEQTAKQLHSYLSMQRQSMEHIRQIRHDMRHYVNNITALLRAGNIEKALDFAEQFSADVMGGPMERLCQNETMNAILAYYVDRARAEGVEVFTRLDIPEELPVDLVELSTMLSNAIDNALIACKGQPPGEKRRIELVAVSQPQITIEVSNTYSGPVQFGRDGLPLAQRAGHGFGTQNIAAFARKYNAEFHYHIKDGMFRLYLMLP